MNPVVTFESIAGSMEDDNEKKWTTLSPYEKFRDLILNGINVNLK